MKNALVIATVFVSMMAPLVCQGQRLGSSRDCAFFGTALSRLEQIEQRDKCILYLWESITDLSEKVFNLETEIDKLKGEKSPSEPKKRKRP